MRSIHVVAALIERDGKFLLDRRPEGSRHAGLWEFPGGKREPGETDREALKRELMEELGVESTIGDEVARSVREDITLVLYRAKIDGEPFPKEAAELGWFDRQSILTLSVPPADKALIEAVRALS